MNEEHVEYSRKVAREGSVLLKNNGILPLKDDKVVLLGKGMVDYVKGGGGSGDVNVAYIVNFLDGMKKVGFSVFEPIADFYREYVESKYEEGGIPGLIAEPELSSDLLDSAAEFADTAVLFFSRFSGENWDRAAENSTLYSSAQSTERLLNLQNSIFEHGDYYLSDAESRLVLDAKSRFRHVVVVLNAGGVVDTTWIKEDEAIEGAILAFQGGQEGGLAVGELLKGLESPSGRLTDTYATSLEGYPSTATFHDSLERVEYTDDVFVGYRYFNTVEEMDGKIAYPFGYGLSYTSFTVSVKRFSAEDDIIKVDLNVKNIGNMQGRDVCEIWTVIPRNLIDGPSRILCGFAKTPLLLPDEAVDLHVEFKLDTIASFDDEGRISSSSWVLEDGRYEVLVTDDGVDFVPAGEFLNEDIRVLQTLSDVLKPLSLSGRMRSDGRIEKLAAKRDGEMHLESGIGRQNAQELEYPEPYERCFDNASDKLQWSDLKVMDDITGLVSDMDIDELIDVISGEPNKGYANTYGMGNEGNHGIPSVMTADGPAGIRFRKSTGVTATAFPCATLVASTWDVEAAEMIGRYGAEEARTNDIGVWLSPAVNIHRSPLCGRNFEYWSEDPLLTGKMAAAFIRGVQSMGVSACIKHFACNNKETNRKESDSIVSQRALREIYLKPFEIAISDSSPMMLMSSYNWLNGIRASENRELLTDVLRVDWHYEGMVVSDWWNHGEQYLEVLAGNDLKMARGYPERLKEALSKGLLKREDIEASAVRILRTIWKLTRS